MDTHRTRLARHSARWLFVSLATVFALFAGVSAVVADHTIALGASGTDQSGLCTGDYFNFCFPMRPYSAELAQCFHRSIGRLSYACRTSIQTFLRNNPDARTGRIRRPQ